MNKKILSEETFKFWLLIPVYNLTLYLFTLLFNNIIIFLAWYFMMNILGLIIYFIIKNLQVKIKELKNNL